MNEKIEMTTYAQKSIINQLVDIDERKNEIVDEIFSEPSKMRDDFIEFLEYYVRKLEELLESIQIVERPDREKAKVLNFLPYIIIGSTVELENGCSGDTEVYKIVSPYGSAGLKNELSYLSELGKALMLRKTGDTIEADESKGVCTYKIKSIKYDG